MPCFCRADTAPLRLLMPRANLSVRAVPPQLADLIPIMGAHGPTGMSVVQSRPDLTLNAMLPAISPEAWFRSILPTEAWFSPMNGGPLLSVAGRLSALGMHFPMQDPRALLADIRRTLSSFAKQMMPTLSAARALPKMQMSNMVLAARMTLSMRQMGICPMALSGVDMSMDGDQSAGTSQARFNAAMQQAPKHYGPMLPPFGLPFPKMALAMSLASLAPAMSAPSTLGAPPIADPGFAEFIQAQLANLAALPPFPFDPAALLADVTNLSDLAAINEAFGPDAMTSGGVTKVNQMLNFFATLRLPALPSYAADLIPMLDTLPEPSVVETTANTLSANSMPISAMITSVPSISIPPALFGLEALSTLKQVLDQALNSLPRQGCAACAFAA